MRVSMVWEANQLMSSSLRAQACERHRPFIPRIHAKKVLPRHCLNRLACLSYWGMAGRG